MKHHHSSSVLATPLDDEDLLREILLRLPPNPSSLPPASLVCKRWRNILSDPEFLKRFRKHHQKPPLLGFFVGIALRGEDVFTPVLESPDRIPSTRFSVPERRSPDQGWIFTGCRHGLAVLVHPLGREIVVWDPLTGQQHRVDFPRGPNYKRVRFFQAAVLCADEEYGHVHGDCFLSPFKLVLICVRYKQAFCSLYNSVSGVWGNIVSTTTIGTFLMIRPSILVKNALCWSTYGGNVLMYDFARESLSVIQKPAYNHVTKARCSQLLRMDGGGLGLAVLSELVIQLWELKSNFDGSVGWVLLQKTIQLEEGIIPWGVPTGNKMVLFVGYDEDTNVIVLTTTVDNFMLQLDSMQIRHIGERNKIFYEIFYPYKNFYTAGRGVGWKCFDLKL